MMMADQTIIEQIPNRKQSLKIKISITMPETIPSDFLKTITQQKVYHGKISKIENQLAMEINQDLIKSFTTRLTEDETFLKQVRILMQEYAKKHVSSSKSDPIMDELLKESEASLTRVWNTGYDDDWD